MEKYSLNLYFLLLLLCSNSSLQAQLFNFDYLLSDQTFSTQTSLVANADGSALSVHNKAERGIIADVASRDILINQVDQTGNVLFTKVYGTNGLNERGNSVAPTADGGYIIVGTQLHPDFRSNGVLAFKINAAGVVQWAYWYGLPETRIGGEAFVIRNFDNERFLIAGTANANREIIGLLIKENGGLIWSKRYNPASISTVDNNSKVVTDLIEDQVLDGFIVAGTAYKGAINPNNGSAVFTMGIDLNGNITRNFALHLSRGYSTFNPSLAPAFSPGNFVLTCGARNGRTDGLPNSYTVVMELDDNLDALWTNFYTSPGTINQHGHSIYRIDDQDRYAVGCQYQSLSPNLLMPTNTAFLTVSSTGVPIGLLRYKRNTNQNSTFMAFDATNENFLLKSDNQFYNNFSLGLIRTSLSGRASCARTEAVNSFAVLTERFPSLTGSSNFASRFDTRLPEAGFELRPDQCFFESQSEALASNNQNSKPIAAGEVQVYPTLASEANDFINVEFQLDNATQASISVYDTFGRLLIEQTTQANTGFNLIQLEGRHLSSGINLIQVRTNDQQLNQTVKVVKQ